MLFGCPSSSTCSFDSLTRDRFVHDESVVTTRPLRGCPLREFVPTSLSFGFPIDTLVPRRSHRLVAPRGQFVSRRSHRLVAHAMSLFSRRRLLYGAPQNKSVASTLALHGCPHLAFVAPRSRRSLATTVEFVVFTLPFNRSPGCPSWSCARPATRLPEREPVRFRSPSPSFPGNEGLRVSVSRIHEARSIIGLPIMKRAPHMVPEAMKSSPNHARKHNLEWPLPDGAFWTRNPRTTKRSRGCPRDRAIVTAQVARVSKPTSSLQFPEAPRSTAPHDRLHHEVFSAAPVSRNDKSDLTARGARTFETNRRLSFPSQRSTPIARGSCTAAHASPGFPGEGSAVAQVSCAADLLRRPVSRAEQHIQPRSPPAHVELASPLRSPGSAMRARRHGLLELVLPVFFARLPEHRSPASLRAVRV